MVWCCLQMVVHVVHGPLFGRRTEILESVSSYRRVYAWGEEGKTHIYWLVNSSMIEEQNQFLHHFRGTDEGKKPGALVRKKERRKKRKK